MSSALFRQLASGGQAQRPDRLFRAAVSAFVSLTRPTRREIAQLDDLALPLYASIALETKRYAAAALSECSAVPPALLRKLANEAPEISAPLLIRSPALSDVDLIGLIARHGSPHARVIGRRASLNAAIASLIRVLSARDETVCQGAMDNGSELEENVRNRLRLLMRTANSQSSSALEETDLPPAHIAEEQLRRAALSSEPGAFNETLSSLLSIPIETAREITGFPTYGELNSALKVLDLSETSAFLLVSALFPGLFTSPASIGFFLERYAALERPTALSKVRGWRDGVAPQENRDQLAAISK